MAVATQNKTEPKLGMARIGPAAWRNNTLVEIKTAQNTIQRSDKSNELGRTLDPLPHLRDVVGTLTNDEAHRYFRQVRAVACLLRESVIDTNEEIKNLTRVRELLEKATEYIRKDIKVNDESCEVRKSRPSREKEYDGADDLLLAERHRLRNLKNQLEMQLKLVQKHIMHLGQVRKRLMAVLQERSRVLDLVCLHIPTVTASSAADAKTKTPRCTRPRYGLSASAEFDRTNDGLVMDALGPYTPDVDQALAEAKDARSKSARLRKESTDLIDAVFESQQKAHRAVNSGILGKVAETNELRQRLLLNRGEARHALNRAWRFFDATDYAWSLSKGPHKSTLLNVREKQNRPIVEIMQRHPGQTMPEPEHIINAGNGLLDSLRRTRENIGSLRLAQMRVNNDIRDKTHGMNTDSSALRLRRRKADHRWAMGAAF